MLVKKMLLQEEKEILQSVQRYSITKKYIRPKETKNHLTCLNRYTFLEKHKQNKNK